RDAKSHLTPADVFGMRVREARELLGWSQAEAAKQLGVERTTLNKIERGVRSDVRVSQLFEFALTLKTNPVHLLTPRQDGQSDVQLAVGGPVLSPQDARSWIRGAPLPGVNQLEWLLNLPRDEQRTYLEGLLIPDDPNAPQLARAMVRKKFEPHVVRAL